MRRKITLAVLALAQATVLTACGGGGGGGGSGEPTSTELSYNEIDTRLSVIARETARVAQNQGATQDMQTTGTASYSGVASFNRESMYDTQAIANLTADFGAGTVQGQLTNFTDRSGTDYSGTVAITNGKVNGSDVSANLAGTLETDSPLLGTVSLTGTASPTFLGAGNNYMRGATSTEWIIRSGTNAEYSDTVTGDLILER